MPHHIFQKNDSQEKNDPVTTHVLPCILCLQNAQSPIRFKKRNVLDAKKEIQSQLKQFPKERFHSIRTILLHENDSAS
jgi:hypothetical protein